jgi:hypothetical protein
MTPLRGAEPFLDTNGDRSRRILSDRPPDIRRGRRGG